MCSSQQHHWTIDTTNKCSKGGSTVVVGAVQYIGSPEGAGVVSGKW